MAEKVTVLTIGGLVATEQWVDDRLDQVEFVTEFNAHFREKGEIEHIPLAPDVNPGYQLYRITICEQYVAELKTWLVRYALEHESRQERAFPSA